MSDQKSREASHTEESTNVLRFTSANRAVKRETLPTDPFTPEERKELRELMSYVRKERPIYEKAKTRCTILARLTEG
jgi:hypothetical protein